MNCAYKNYLYIYNIKLMKENILLIKKNLQTCFFFCFIYSKKTFLLAQPNIFFFTFENKKCFPKFISQKTIFFFSENTKNYS